MTSVLDRAFLEEEAAWHARAARRARRRLLAARAAVAVAALLLWEAASGPLVDPFWFSEPSEIVARLGRWVADGSLWAHLAATLFEMAMGLALGVPAAVALGFALGTQRLLARVMSPIVVALYNVPKIALAPLFIVWFGIHFMPKIVLVAVTVFFLVFFSVYAGVRDVDPDLVTTLRLMGGKGRDILLRVIAPASLPWIFAGLKIALPYSLIAAVVGEMMVSNRGVGYLVMSASGMMDTAGVFAGLVLLMVIGLTVNGLAVSSELRLTRWRRAGR